MEQSERKKKEIKDNLNKIVAVSRDSSNIFIYILFITTCINLYEFYLKEKKKAFMQKLNIHYAEKMAVI